MVSRDLGDTWAHVGDSVFINSFISDILVLPGLGSNGMDRWVVSTRSHFRNKNLGGIYYSNDNGATWTQSLYFPVFSLVQVPGTGTLYAALPLHAPDAHVMISQDGGRLWLPHSRNLNFHDGYLPFYPKLSISPVNQTDGSYVVMYVALSVNLENTSDTSSAMFFLDSQKTPQAWEEVVNMPNNLDRDNMPKDRCAVLHDPAQPGLAFVAGNGNSVVYRVLYRSSTWTRMWGADTEDKSEPHVDCRNFAWEAKTDSLMLVTDGGIFVRTSPREAGKGQWVSAAGDAGIIELYNIGYENRNDRYVVGAQDNSVLIAHPGGRSGDAAIGVVGGDGTMVSVDNVNCPGRMYGCAQFLEGWSYFEGGLDGSPLSSMSVPFRSHFKDISANPFFLTWFQTNRLDPDQLLFAVNGTSYGEAGLWKFDPVPSMAQLHAMMTPEQRDAEDLLRKKRVKTHKLKKRFAPVTDLVEIQALLKESMKTNEDDVELYEQVSALILASAWPAPTLVAPTPGATLFVFAVGSHTYNGNKLQPDPEAMAGMNNTHLFTRTSASPSWQVMRCEFVVYNYFPKLFSFIQSFDYLFILNYLSVSVSVSVSVSASVSVPVSVSVSVCVCARVCVCGCVFVCVRKRWQRWCDV